MTEEAGFAEPTTPAPGPDDAGLPGTGPVAPDTPGPGPVTVAPEPAAADVAPPDSPPAAADPGPAELEAVSPTAAAAAEPDPGPFIPAEGVPGWLRDALTDYHRRLLTLEG